MSWRSLPSQCHTDTGIWERVTSSAALLRGMCLLLLLEPLPAHCHACTSHPTSEQGAELSAQQGHRPPGCVSCRVCACCLWQPTCGASTAAVSSADRQAGWLPKNACARPACFCPTPSAFLNCVCHPLSLCCPQQVGQRAADRQRCARGAAGWASAGTWWAADQMRFASRLASLLLAAPFSSYQRLCIPWPTGLRSACKFPQQPPRLTASAVPPLLQAPPS